MAKSSKREFDKAFAAILAETQATRTVDPVMAADLERRRSGAAGTHADSNVRRDGTTAGRTNRVGSRSSQRRAAVRDCY